MKKSILVLAALASLSSYAKEKTYEYSCSCVDIGLECDGMENMNVSITGTQATIDLGSEDWEMNDGWEATLDPSYSPRSEENKAFAKFTPESGGGGYGYDPKKSTFLIEKTMLAGKKTGDVKFNAVDSVEEDDAAEGKTAGYTKWLFRCEKN
jgi:hypothetical protein